jgi:hypothetical protein
VSPVGIRVAAVLVAAGALAAGCAATRAGERMTFAEAGLAPEGEPERPPAPPVEEPAPRRVAAEPPAGPPIDPLLLAFAAEARARRARPAARPGFPGEAAAAWAALAGEVARYLERPMPQTPLLELVRTRVALEAELEFDRRRFGEPPAALVAAVEPLL